jgi:PAS domain-containing protein
LPNHLKFRECSPGSLDAVRGIANGESSTLRGVRGQTKIPRASNSETRPSALSDVNGVPREAIEALPAAVYMTDAEGRITFYNEAAAAFWGCRPELGGSKYCGSWKLY